jgi:hypothetical protein
MSIFPSLLIPNTKGCYGNLKFPLHSLFKDAIMRTMYKMLKFAMVEVL